jgi:periplasmic protein TonB
MAARRPLRLGFLASLLLHFGAVTALSRVEREPASTRRLEPIELQVVETPPPPPPEPAPEPPPPPKLAVVRRRPRPPLQTAPPPPNKPPPPQPIDEPPTPVFGLTEDSVVEGDSPVAMPVGNTVMVKPETPRSPGPPTPLPGAETPFAPVGDIYLKQFARKLREEKAPMPENALRMGIGGQVVMRVGVDRDGKVRSVRVIKPGGHGFDEAASKAMWKFRFSPCIDMQGRTVDCLLTYLYRFEAPR